MKILGVILSLAICCGNCLAAGPDTGGAGVRLPRHIKKGVRTDGKPDPTDIKPVAQKNGIKSGFVVIYGHPVQPPYQVRVADNKVLINEVPVGPGTTDGDVLTENAMALRVKAEKMFCDSSGKESATVLADEILALFKQSADTVINARWSSVGTPPETTLLVYWKRGVRQSDVRFSAKACARATGPEAARAARQARVGEKHARAFRRALEEGRLLFFGSDGKTMALPVETAGKLEAVMKDKTLDRQGVTKKLETLGFHGHAAREILRNYEQ